MADALSAISKSSTITLGWGPDKAAVLGPDRAWLRKRKLDLLRWSSGLPALGPEALLVQLSARPTSFHPWADLAPNLTSLAESCGAPRLLDLLDNHKTTVYQRAAYLLDTGGNPSAADQVLAGRPSRSLSHVVLGAGPDSVFSAKHRLTDRLVAPFLTQYGKA